MKQQATIIAFATVLVLAVLEIGWFNSLRFGQYMIHPVLFYVILNRRTQSLAARVGLGAFGGVLLDAFAPAPYGQWLLGLSLGVLVSELIFTQWLSHRSWIAPIALCMLGWIGVRGIGIVLNISTHSLTEMFSQTGFAFLGRDILWTLAGVIVVTAVSRFTQGQHHSYAAA